jgi:TonB family protein
MVASDFNLKSTHMKTLLLLFGTAVVFGSCIEVPKSSEENVSTEEMKSRVEAEEISFDAPKSELIASFEHKIPPPERGSDSGCILEPSCMVGDSIEEKSTVRLNVPQPTSSERVYYYADVDPTFPGGSKKLAAFLQANLRYPPRGIDLGGRVYVSFVVGTDGAISQAKIMRGISKECDEEALRVVQMMPNWIPAEQNGKKIAVEMRLPITFTLN